MPRRTTVDVTSKEAPTDLTSGEYFTTNDLNLATWLKTLGIRLVDVRRQDIKRSVFLFREPGRCHQLAIEWINEADEPVQASRYSRELTRLKNLALNAT